MACNLFHLGSLQVGRKDLDSGKSITRTHGHRRLCQNLTSSPFPSPKVSCVWYSLLVNKTRNQEEYSTPHEHFRKSLEMQLTSVEAPAGPPMLTQLRHRNVEPWPAPLCYTWPPAHGIEPQRPRRIEGSRWARVTKKGTEPCNSRSKGRY